MLVSYKIIKRYEEIQISNEFKENEHPRDKDGKFTSAGKGYTNSSVIDIKGNELGEFTDIKEARLKAKEYYKKHLQGKIIHKDGIDIQFSGRGLRETIHASAIQKLNLIPSLERIIKTGKMSEEKPLKHIRRDRTKSFREITNDINIDGEHKKVLVYILQDTSGHWYYDIALLKIKKEVDNNYICIENSQFDMNLYII